MWPRWWDCSALSHVGPERWMIRRKASGLLLYYDYVARARRRRVIFLQDECVLSVEQCTKEAAGTHALSLFRTPAGIGKTNTASQLTRLVQMRCARIAWRAAGNSFRFALFAVQTLCVLLLNCRDDKLCFFLGFSCLHSPGSSAAFNFKRKTFL
jgi:hypothetical protein